jgi:hypothetical protein
MRKLFVLTLASLTACAANASQPAAPAEGGSPTPIPVHGVTPGHACQTTGTHQFVGQPGDDKTGAAILRASHAAVLRWAPPGTMLTMDYREDRVTIYLGRDRKVTQIRCG